MIIKQRFDCKKRVQFLFDGVKLYIQWTEANLVSGVQLQETVVVYMYIKNGNLQ